MSEQDPKLNLFEYIGRHIDKNEEPDHRDEELEIFDTEWQISASGLVLAANRVSFTERTTFNLNEVELVENSAEFKKIIDDEEVSIFGFSVTDQDALYYGHGDFSEWQKVREPSFAGHLLSGLKDLESTGKLHLPYTSPE